MHWISGDIDWESVSHDDAPSCQRIACKACRQWIAQQNGAFATQGVRPLYCEHCGQWFCTEACKGNARRHPCARRYNCGHPKTAENTYADANRQRCRRCKQAWQRARKQMIAQEADGDTAVKAASITAAYRRIR
jgi:hypothetical protein